MGVGFRLSLNPTYGLCEALAARTDDRHIVVELLGAPGELVQDTSLSGQSLNRRIVCRSQNQ